MPCFTVRRRGQTVDQRRREVKKAITAIDQLLATRRATIKVGPQGAITFLGVPNEVRDDVTDECVYRELQKSGSSAYKLALAQAEMLAGRAVNPTAMAMGIHSHDGGNTWHPRG
jgi:hypothetical protein